MARTEKLTVAEALAQAQLIESALAAWDGTAPEFVASIGGRDALARMSEVTCIGPVPRLDEAAWQRASEEYEGRRRHERNYTPPEPPEQLPVVEPPKRAKRSRWGIFGR